MLVPMNDQARIHAWLLETTRLMVDHPEQVRVELISPTALRITVSHSDIGKMIGRTGRTARSIRTILGAIGMAHGSRYALDIVESGP